MTQRSLNDNWETSDADDNRTDNETNTDERTDRVPLDEHPATSDIDTGAMALTSGDALDPDVPHPDDMTTLLPDAEGSMSLHQSTYPDDVKEAMGRVIDGIEQLRHAKINRGPEHIDTSGVDDVEPEDVVTVSLDTFIVMTPDEVYDYLKSMQHKTDRFLHNFDVEQIGIQGMSRGNGYSKGLRLEDKDKAKILAWEVNRRRAIRGFNMFGPGYDLDNSDENRGLPNKKSKQKAPA